MHKAKKSCFSCDNDKWEIFFTIHWAYSVIARQTSNRNKLLFIQWGSNNLVILQLKKNEINKQQKFTKKWSKLRKIILKLVQEGFINGLVKEKEERANENNNKFCSKLLNSTLRVPVGQSGQKWAHSSSLALGYIVVLRKVLICEFSNLTY